MENLQIDNLDEQPISFDLTDEDIESIKGGIKTIDISSISTKPPFPIKITAIPIHSSPIYPIRIVAIQIKTPASDILPSS